MGRPPVREPKLGSVTPWLFRHALYAVSDALPDVAALELFAGGVVDVVDVEVEDAYGEPPPHAASVTATAARAAPTPNDLLDRRSLLTLFTRLGFTAVDAHMSTLGETVAELWRHCDQL